MGLVPVSNTTKRNFLPMSKDKSELMPASKSELDSVPPLSKDKPNLTLKPTVEKEFLSTNEVAMWLDVSITTVYRLVERGELPVYRIGRINKFRKSDLEEFVQKNKLIGTSAIHSLTEESTDKE